MTENVTPKQRKAIEQLLLTGNIGDAAKSAGVNRKTVHEWFKQPAFIAALREAERLALDTVSRELVALASEATATLREVTGGDATTGHKLRAAEITLNNLLKVRELVDLEARILALEAAQGGSNED